MSDAPESSKSIREKVQSGEFFRESLEAYHVNYHDLMSERYFFISITVVAVLIFILSLVSIIAMHPLQKEVPFIYQSVDTVNDYPYIKTLGSADEDPNQLLKRFLINNYVKLREDYSVDSVDRSATGVKSQSAPEVYAEYAKLMDPRNPNSPIKKFQRQAVRKVFPLAHAYSSAENGAERMIVSYKEQVVTGPDISTRNRRAIITFRFDDIQVNQSTGQASKLNFNVLAYKTEAVN